MLYKYGEIECKEICKFSLLLRGFCYVYWCVSITRGQNMASNSAMSSSIYSEPLLESVWTGQGQIVAGECTNFSRRKGVINTLHIIAAVFIYRDSAL